MATSHGVFRRYPRRPVDLDRRRRWIPTAPDGDVGLTLTPATVRATAVAITPSNDVVVGLTPAASTAVAVALTPQADVITALTPASATSAAVAVTPLVGVAVALTPATVSATAVAVTPLVGALVTLTPAAVTATAVAVTPSNDVVAALTPAAATTTAVAFSATEAAASGDVSVTLTPSSATATAVPLTATDAEVSAPTPTGGGSQEVIESQPIPVRRRDLDDDLRLLPAVTDVTLEPIETAVTIALLPGVSELTTSVIDLPTYPTAILEPVLDIPAEPLDAATGTKFFAMEDQLDDIMAAAVFRAAKGDSAMLQRIYEPDIKARRRLRG